MRYTLDNGKIVTIPDEEIKKSMEKLELSENDAIDLWLEDHDYQVNEEQDELDQKAKSVKIQHDAQDIDKKFSDKPKKPRTIKISDEKKSLFSNILQNLSENYENVEILTENKLISVKIGEKTFKIDLIEQRNKKK